MQLNKEQARKRMTAGTVYRVVKIGVGDKPTASYYYSDKKSAVQKYKYLVRKYPMSNSVLSVYDPRKAKSTTILMDNYDEWSRM